MRDGGDLNVSIKYFDFRISSATDLWIMPGSFGRSCINVLMRLLKGFLVKMAVVKILDFLKKVKLKVKLVISGEKIRSWISQNLINA